MRPLHVVVLLLSGCALTGTGSGFSTEAENHLRSLGPQINTEFSLAGNSLVFESGRRLSLLVRDEAFVTLHQSEQESQSRAIAEWIWRHGGEDAGLMAITVAAVGEDVSDKESRSYRFIASELAGAIAE